MQVIQLFNFGTTYIIHHQCLDDSFNKNKLKTFRLQKSGLDIADVSLYLKIYGTVFDSEKGLRSNPG